MLNEIDDQFALTYLLLSINPSDLALITIAPFTKSYFYKQIPDNIKELSKEEIIKIGNLLNIDLTKKVNLGAENNINEIIDMLDKNDKILIFCNASLTNIATVFKLRPDLSKKCEIIWLGGISPFYYDTNELNLNQDPQAARTVLKSNAKVTVIPAWCSASHLYMPICVSEKYIKPCGELGEYLHNLLLSFNKGTPFSGKKLWDMATVATHLFKERIEIYDKTLDPRFRDIKVKTYYDVDIDEENNFVFKKSGDKPTKFVVGLLAERIFDDFIKRLKSYKK